MDGNGRAGADEHVEVPEAGRSTATCASTAHAEYYPCFDWLRLGLASLVVMAHDGDLKAWPHAGNFAVQVFFALSGWLIGGILLKSEPAGLPRFYFNRAIRIWVPYAIALTLLLTAGMMHDRMTSKWLEFAFYKATFVYNVFGTRQLASYRYDMPLQGTGNHFWSVDAEEQFYLLAPLLLVLVPRRHGRSVLLWTALALAAWLSRTYASIVFGVLAAVAVERHGCVHTTPAARYVLSIALALAAVGMAMRVDYALLAPLCAIAIVMLLAIRGPQRRSGAFFGGLSYPLYLNHWIGVFLANALCRPFGMKESLLRHALSCGFALAIAAAMYWWIDRRLLARRAMLYTRQRGQLAIAIAYGGVLLGACVGLSLLG